MYLRMLQIDDFVKLNNLREIKDPIYMQFKQPTPEGLFSHEIFGITQYDRSTIWGYIDLGARFLHPLAANNFKKYGSTFENIIYGLKRYRMVDGEFIEDEENGDTGIDFLYENYDNIKWRDTPSIGSSERIKFLKQGKDRIFITKFPVCPPFYRDINDNSSTGIPVVNELYKKVISQCMALKKKGSFSFFGNLTRANIQKTLVEIFDHYVTSLKGKTGLMRRSVMGRNIDYGVWCVLASPVIDCERYDEMLVDFDHMGIPLAAVLAMFKPFILQATKDFFANEFVRSGKYPVLKMTGKGKYETVLVDFIDPLSEFSDDFIDKRIANFVNGYSTRFEPIEIPSNREGIKGYLSISGRFGSDEKISTRPMTWTDLFFIVAEECTQDKSAIWSRYPIDHFYSVEYPKVRVMSTITTTTATIDNKTYKWYPNVKVGQDSSSDFVATIAPCNVNIGALGADYDGDSTPLRGIFTAEGNIEAEKFRRDKKNFLDLQGRNIRPTEKDFCQLMYSLTKPSIVMPGELEDPN